MSRGGSTRRWRRLRLLVLERDQHRCAVPRQDGTPCGAFATHVDHVRPVKHGGGDDLENLRAACRACNLSRGAKWDAPAAPASPWDWAW